MMALFALNETVLLDVGSHNNDLSWGAVSLIIDSMGSLRFRVLLK